MGDPILAVAQLTDSDLLIRMRLLSQRERAATVELLVHLAELDARKLYLSQGFSSLFSYCTQVLQCSEHGAYNRIEAARASRKYPIILDRLAGGSLNLSTLRLLTPHLTPENHADVLRSAANKSKREVEVLVARLAPRPDVPTSLRMVSRRRLSGLGGPQIELAANQSPASCESVPQSEGGPCSATQPIAAQPSTAQPLQAQSRSSEPLLDDPYRGLSVAAIESAGAVPRSAPVRSGSRVQVEPLSPERYRVQFTIGRRTYEGLRRAQELLRREIPDGDPAAIFDRALSLLLDNIARRKWAAVARPKPAGVSAVRSRHVAAHVKRAVWVRDGGRCAFFAKNGRRCGEGSTLEFHHVAPYSIGGETTVANLSLRCRAHNAHESELAFGPFAAEHRENEARSHCRGYSTRPGAR
ncbi:MAG: HNH endonuclease [Burkholderiales bacterium]